MIHFHPEFTLGMSLPLAAALGALHVLEPAHGRSIFHAFLVGSSGKPRNIIAFALTVMLTHTAVAFAIAIAFGLGGEALAEHGLAPLAKLIGALLTLYIGFRMWQHGRRHAQAHGHRHEHGEECGPAMGAALNPVGLGFVGGLIPCYGSIAFIGLGVARGSALASAAPVLAFGAGLGFTLMAAGFVAMRARQTALAQWSQRRLGHWADFAAAVLVIGLGLVSGWVAITEFSHGAH